MLDLGENGKVATQRLHEEFHILVFFKIFFFLKSFRLDAFSLLIWFVFSTWFIQFVDYILVEWKPKISRRLC